MSFLEEGLESMRMKKQRMEKRDDKDIKEDIYVEIVEETESLETSPPVVYVNKLMSKNDSRKYQ